MMATVALVALALAVVRACEISFNVTTLTDTNDNIGGYGGWGPHLRSVLRDSKGNLVGFSRAFVGVSLCELVRFCLSACMLARAPRMCA